MLRIAYLTMGLRRGRGGPRLICGFARSLRNAKPDWKVHLFSLEGTTESPTDGAAEMSLSEGEATYLPVGCTKTDCDAGNSIWQVVQVSLQKAMVYGFATPMAPLDVMFGMFTPESFLSDPYTTRTLLEDLCDSHDILHLGAWTGMYTSALSLLRKRHKCMGSAIVCHAIVHPAAGTSSLANYFGRRLSKRLIDLIRVPALRDTLRGMDAVTVSTPWEFHLLRRLGMKSVSWVGEGIDLDYVSGLVGRLRARSLEASPDEGSILFIGPKCYTKGYYHLLFAFRELVRRNNGLVLRVIGSWTLENNRIARRLQLQAWGIEEELRAKGLVRTYRDVSEFAKYLLISKSNIMVLPSAAETIPLVFLEAWALKKPVIGPSIPTVGSIIRYPGDGGLLVDFGDVVGIRDAIAKLLEDTDFSRSAGRIGYQKVETAYNLRMVARRLIDTYAALEDPKANHSNQTQMSLQRIPGRIGED